MHDVDIEPEHGEFRSAVSVREADRVGESRTDLVLGNHHDVTSVLLHILDDRQIRAVRDEESRLRSRGGTRRPREVAA